jgi:hypothetical protein
MVLSLACRSSMVLAMSSNALFRVVMFCSDGSVTC